MLFPSLLTRAVLAATALYFAACSRVEPGTAPAAGAAVRVVPASATAVDIVHALIDPARVVAIPAQALEYSSVHDAPPPWDAVPTFEAYVAETLLALRPDLVLVEPWQAPETNARLREFGTRVVALPEVRSYDDAKRALLLAAAELHAETAALELIERLDQRVAALHARSGRREKLAGLCYSNFGAAGSTAGAETTIDAMFAMAGLRNLIAERGSTGHVGVNFEDLLTLDPDVIVVSQPLKMAAGSAGDRGGASEELLLREPSLAHLRAVRERRIVALPAWLFATGSHQLVSGAEALDAALDALVATLEARGR